MILGKGTARTESEIIHEYGEFLLKQKYCSEIIKLLLNVPEVMSNRIGKSFSDWEDDDILRILSNRARQTNFRYCSFLSFLFFRGYRKASIYLLSRLSTSLSRYHQEALKPIRQILEDTHSELLYSNLSKVGSVLNRLIWLLAVVGKPLENITRSDFESFREEYQKWYINSGRRKGLKPDHYIARLERYMIHWNILSPVRRMFKHEVYYRRLEHRYIGDAIVNYLNWSEAKDARSTVNSKRAGVMKFFLWLQEEYPDHDRLDDVNREVALEYSCYLKDQVTVGSFAPTYRNGLYCTVRNFYDYVIFEDLETSPHRNPFGLRDMPRKPDPLPRYIPDHQMRIILDYCNNGATLKERVVVTILLHTGIRAFELAKLCETDIVKIQGVWKLHIREGKGLKDRLIPLTPTCLAALREWQEFGWEGVNNHLFTRHGLPWNGGAYVSTVVREMRRKIGLSGITPHRFRHTFAVALLNHGLRESALQKLLGHSTLTMTLKYGRILDKTVELSFNQAIENMQESPLEQVPSFFKADGYEGFTDADALNWVRLPHGYCRRHPKMHCESDVKCLLCDRYCAHSENLDCLQKMHDRYIELDMDVQADVVYSHINILKNHPESKVSEMSQNLISV